MLTQRLGSSTQKDDAFIDSLLAAIEEHPGSCDEVWLASDYGFPPLEVHRASAERLGEIAAKFRERGIRVSLQISNTIGHGQYMSARDCSGLVYDGSPVEKMVGPDGQTADYCFCWNGPNFRRYVLEEVKLYAQIHPHCVWVDDDLRATNHMPVSFGCFCDDCIRRFNERYGSAFSREELVQAINYGEPVWRERYVAFLREGLGEFVYELSKAVAQVSPESYMGYQYCAYGGYTGYDFSFIFDAMRRATGKAPKCRPGGGAYDDHNPNNQVNKALFINWQNYMLPDYVTEIRPEIENLPDVVYGKTIAGTCFETSLYLAYGSNAMSYAMLMNDYEPMEWHSQMLGEFARHRPYWSRLAALSSRTVQGGLQMVLSPSMWKRRLSEEEPPFNWSYEPWEAGTQLYSAAIPLALGRSREPVYLLHGQTAAMFSDRELEELLDKPVITDGAALEVYQSRGLGDRFSARAESIGTEKLYEEFLPHPVNGTAAGRRWSQSFYYKQGHRLVDRGRGETENFGVWRTSSRNAEMCDPNGRYPYGIANGVARTDAGARWAVFGHSPWNGVISKDKRDQILRAADYISGNRLPAVLETAQQAILLPRETADGRTAGVSLVNCTIGRTEPLLLRIRRPDGSRFTVMSADETVENLSYEKDGEDYLVTIPPMQPWSVATLFVEK